MYKLYLLVNPLHIQKHFVCVNEILQPYSVLGEDIATIFGPRMKYCCHINFGPRTELCCQFWSQAVGPNIAEWDQIWQQNSVLGPNMAAILF